MKIRQRDGTMAEVGDNYILRDGEARVVQMMMMDAAQRTVIHDGNGNPPGQRPGFLCNDNDTDFAVRATVYQEYADAISNRWQSGRWQSQPSKPAPSAPQRTFASPQDALAASYAQYDKDISERWRK